jgi:hypothetical protein
VTGLAGFAFFVDFFAGFLETFFAAAVFLAVFLTVFLADFLAFFAALFLLFFAAFFGAGFPVARFDLPACFPLFFLPAFFLAFATTNSSLLFKQDCWG